MFPHLVERAKPGVIAVLPNGKRFVNEADSYHDFIAALLAATPAGDTPQAWLLADRRALRRYGLGPRQTVPVHPHRPGCVPAICSEETPWRSWRSSALSTPMRWRKPLNALTTSPALAKTSIFTAGHQPITAPGGDHQVTLGPLREGPFYAVRILPGSLGTFSGLQTDEHARVLDEQQLPIPGLYAIGNDMSSVMRGYYPSGGITLGPAMTFGYLVGKGLTKKQI